MNQLQDKANRLRSNERRFKTDGAQILEIKEFSSLPEGVQKALLANRGENWEVGIWPGDE